MKVHQDISIRDFDAWSDAIDELVYEYYSDGIDETDLNYLLWFEGDWILRNFHIFDDEDEEE